MPVHGSCLCGTVRFEVDGPLRPVINCHCSQCRKWTGHFVAATAAFRQTLRLDDPQGALKWYRSSDSAQRGFCERCGSSLFWQSDGLDTITILAGTLDGVTGLNTAAHIFADDKGDYYSLSDPHAQVYARSGHNVRLTRPSSPGREAK